MAWFVFNRRSARNLEKSPAISEAGVHLREGNALAEALAAKESILLLPGSVAGAPFLLHIQNASAGEPVRPPTKKWWRW